MSKIGFGDAKKVLTPDEAKAKVTDFINKNLMQPGNEVTVKEITEDGDLYKAVVSLKNGQTVDSYLSKDGSKFFPQVMNVAEIESKAEGDTAEGDQAETPTEVTKSDKPLVELFVMSFCPYGVQAEAALKPVVDLLGTKADIKVRFIASIGETLDSVQSLHGVVEGKEDARQLCVAKNYDQKTLWTYIEAINKDCYPIYRDGEDKYNECWKKAAKAAKIDTGKIDKCMASEGVKLIQAESELSEKYGVSGSPTFMINGAKSNATRTAEGYKKAICDAFNTAPSECSTTLSSEGTAASGDCN